MANVVERAFELAASGECRTLDEIERRLKADGHEGAAQHLRGGSIRKQLRELCKAARAERLGEAG